ncbi:MAG TPA: ribosome-associated translation inhibitor RaiA [Stellaceae bacterium]|jgi:ribosomal subunit interface protein|nr:ribosome-associated translation inhibitor RaiA [Stellaceae bacterium]
MQLTVTGKQIDTGAVLRQHVEASLGAILEKYFKTAIEAHVVFSKEAHLSRAEVAIHIGRGIVVNASASAAETHAAFDAAAERIAKQMRRYKRRLRDHHAQARKAFEVSERAREYVLAPLAEEGEEGQEGGEGPAVVAEMSADLPNLTVSEAVMRMDLANTPVLLFRNRAHGELNLVYRRLDGNIGWVDPELDPTRRIPRSEA